MTIDYNKINKDLTIWLK